MVIFLALGLIASLFQLVIAREFIFSVAKNEFSFIAAIGVWLLFCSVGSRFGRIKKVIADQYIPFVFTLLFCFSLASIHIAKYIIGRNYYEIIDIGLSTAISILLIGPVGFLVGYCFARFARAFLQKNTAGFRHSFNKNKENIYALFFAYEAIGFFIGGLLFAFFLSAYANPFLFSFLPLLFVVFMPLPKKNRFFSVIGIILVGLTFSAGYPLLLKKEFQDAAIISNRGSPYGPLIETEQFGVQSLYVSGNLSATSEDNIWQEAFVHTAVASCQRLDSVLIIGAASFAQIEQLSLYAVGSIECVELNPLLVSWCRSKLAEPLKKQIRFVVDDPRSYLRTTQKRYDCIIMNTTAPSSIALNRYFSQDFFRLVAERLRSQGVFAFSIPSKRDILSPRYIQFNSCIINTVDRIFAQRFIVPSDLMIILASGEAVFNEAVLLSRFQSRQPATEYFTRYHLADSLDAGRRRYVNSMIDRGIAVNTDDRPLGFFYYALLQEAKFHARLWLTPAGIKGYTKVFLSVLVIVWLFLMARRPRWRISFQAAAFGFASISLTSIIIVLFQVFSGALFWKVGIVTGACMLGLAGAVFLVNNIMKRTGFRPFMVSALYVMWLFLFVGLKAGLHAESRLLHYDFVLYAYALLGGICTGAMYPLLSRWFLLNRSQPETVAGRIYSADLLGAFFGTFLCSFVLLPVWGLEASLNILIAAMFLCSLQALRR